MQDQDKTKEQLIDELNEMRRKVTEFEAAEDADPNTVEFFCFLISNAIEMIMDGKRRKIDNVIVELQLTALREVLYKDFLCPTLSAPSGGPSC